jgi:hypothetical protein
VAALPPQPPGGQPPQPPSVSPPSGPPSVGPPQNPYPAATYAPQPFAPQPYSAQPIASAPVKVHKRTFFLTLAQFIIILFAIVRILVGLAAAGFGVLFLTGGRSRLESLPGYEQSIGQLGNDVLNAIAAVLFAFAAYWLISGVIDLILGIIVGRPSNVARWFIIVLDVLSLIYVIDGLANGPRGGLWTLVLLIILVGKVIVLYSLLLDPATRRNFAGKAT